LRDIRELALNIARILSQKGAEKVQVIDIRESSVIADYFVVCGGRSGVQVKALSDEVEDRLEEEGTTVLRKEGYQPGRWIVLDYGDILVHIFLNEEREFYDIERLWVTGDNLIDIE
jgi:ribosome-associated protein